ncbi:MAG: chorismate mutase [Mycobacterium sp.]
MRPMRSHTGTLMSAICAVTLLAGPPTARADTVNPLAELVDAAAQRLQVIDDVAASKWHTGAAIEDRDRVRQQLTALVSAAADANLDPDYVTQLFTDQVGAAEAVEYYRFAQWKLNPATVPAAAPDLAASRARIDGLNHVMLTQIGVRWQQLHSPECIAQLDEATRDVSVAGRFDAFGRQALSAATRNYCAR